MEGIYPVIIGGGVCGKLRVEKAGAYTLFRAECPMQEGVIRLSVYGGGIEGYLGVPLPSDGKLFLEKKLSPAALRAFPAQIDHCGLAGEKPEPDVPEEACEPMAQECGEEPAEACELCEACEEPTELEEEAAQAAQDEEGPFWYATTDGALVSRSEGVEMVALPTDDERVPENIPGQARVIEGKEYLVYITKEM